MNSPANTCPLCGLGVIAEKVRVRGPVEGV